MTKKEIEFEVLKTNLFVIAVFMLAAVCGSGLAWLEIVGK